MDKTEFKTEWCLLQNQFDSYEKHSLYIKLLSIILFLLAEMTNVISIFMVLLIAVLWLQDAIWKTFQSRIETRLLQIEHCISGGSETTAFQFNREYQHVCLSGQALIKEYFNQSIRPTVAFPYLALLGILLLQYLY